MVLELHVLGPGFGLPSIDAECLAAIIYLRQAFTDHDNSWNLVASNNFDVSPFRKLPALYVRGATDDDLWVAGFDDIVEYLREAFGSTVDLDDGLSKIQQADSYALKSFIRSRGAPLLDLNFYVSSENYHACTRPALGALLTWPESWIVPHRLRDDARRKSDHLGLSALDVDMLKAEQEKEDNKGLSAHIPKSLRRPVQSVSGLLGKSAQQTRFRLDAVTEGFFAPLQERLVAPDKKGGLIGQGFHSVDCLAVAYLVLIQRPELPQTWLQDTLTTKYAMLDRWVRTQAQGSANIGEMSAAALLPWKTPTERTISQTALAVVENIVSSIPGLRSGYEFKIMEPHGDSLGRSREDKQLAYSEMRKRQMMYSQVLTSTIATTSVLAWLAHTGIFSFSRSASVSRGRHFGEAGSILLGLR